MIATGRPATRYAKSGDVHIAYQVSGDGSIDILLIPDGVIPIEAMLDEPHFEQFVRRLAGFARVIRFDRRGMGLSDPVTPSDPPTLERWAQDAVAVLDAVGSTRTAIVAMAEGGFVATLLAATRPERFSALVLIHATPGFVIEPFATGAPARMLERLRAGLDSDAPVWGDIDWAIPLFAPSAIGDQRYHEWLANAARRAMSPGMARALFDVVFKIDIRSVLPAVRVPTLVIHRRWNLYVSPDHGKYVADRIPGARYVEVEGADHVPYLGDAEPILAEIAKFLTGDQPRASSDRVLSTILFGDIVGSTERLAEIGDARWRALLLDYQARVGREIDRHGGRVIDWAGDGVLASFDGPARAVRAACAIRASARSLGLEARGAVHTGECEVVGVKLGGIAVHIGSRILGLAASGEVLASSTVHDLVAGSGLRFDDRGAHRLKGVADEWRLYAVDQTSAVI
jgi:pimeloyl-ACP methyl ester carboxylesterase